MKEELDSDEILEKYEKLKEKDGIRENDEKVSTRIHLMFGKAQNNLKIARGIFEISINPKIKELLNIKLDDSFFDWVTQAAYYAMFHAANALLATKKIRITRIDSHSSTLYAFGKYFIINKELEEELFFIYQETEEKALELFSTLAEEKRKRGIAAYERLSKANKDPAEESLKNARNFVKTIGEVLAQHNYI